MRRGPGETLNAFLASLRTVISGDWPLSPVFRYVSLARHVCRSLTSLFLCIWLGPWLIQKLREFQIGQHIRDDGPKSHQKKAGTPTMGGVLIIISIVIPVLLWADLRRPVCLAGTVRPCWRSGDYRLYRRLRQAGDEQTGHLGLTAWQKFTACKWR